MNDEMEKVSKYGDYILIAYGCLAVLSTGIYIYFHIRQSYVSHLTRSFLGLILV